MRDEELRGRLAAFLPRTIWPLLAAEPRHAHLEGCVLFADLAGFTALTENLAKIGKEGAEELTRILNDFFAAMIRIVHEEGGDVLRFGGDAMTLFFPEGGEGGLRAAVRMQREARRFGSIATRGGTFALGMKIGASDGSVLFGTVGDTETGRDYFAAGAALDEAAEAEHHATRGQIVLAPSCSSRLPPGLRGLTRLAGGFVLLEPGGEAIGEFAADGHLTRAAAEGSRPSQEALEAFLPPFIVSKVRLVDGLSAAEHRRTSVLFLAFRGLDYEGDGEAARKVDGVYRELAETVKRFGGWINKVDMGDKGSKVIALFGAPHALENQEDAACRAALAILASSALRGLIADLRVGVTAAPLFAAYVGSEDRREYTVMGDGINMAARLMANAHPWRVLCSEEVMRKASSSLAFRALDPIFVKGKVEKIPIFRPEGEREEAAVQKARFVGREALLAQILPSLLAPSETLELAISGEPGVGKSALLHRLGQGMDEAGLRHVTLVLVAHSASSYMAAWRPLLLLALGASLSAPDGIKEAALRAAAAQEDPGYLPLFNPLLGLSLPETPATGTLSAKERKDVLFAMLARLFVRQAEGGPYGIFVDHLEHADPASLEFLQVMEGEMGGRPLKLLLAFRGQAAERLTPFTAGFQQVALPPLDSAEAREYLSHVAGIASPTETFPDFVHKKTGGNPTFLRQIIEAMVKEGIVSPGPSGRLEPDEDRLASAVFPDTLEGLLLSRVDSLPERERAFLKAASVLGPAFSLNLLRALMDESAETVLETVRSLEAKGLVRMDSWGARPYATFVDSLLRDALYEAFNFAVKRSFHERVANILEEEGAEVPRLWPALAHHFEAAGDGGKAAHYLWRSAEDARSRFDNYAAFALLGRYVALREKDEASLASDEEFRKGLMYLAESAKELGRLEEADATSRRIVDTVSNACPETVVSLMRLADNHRRRGQLQEALELYGKAMKQANGLGNRELECRVLLDSGVPLAMSGEMDEAMERFQQAGKLARKIKAHTSLVFALMNQGMCHYYGGKNREAIVAYRSALRTAKIHGLKASMVSVSVNLATALFDAGSYDNALKIVVDALPIARAFGLRNALAATMSNRAVYETFLGRLDEADLAAVEALGYADHHRMGYWRSVNLSTLGILHAEQGKMRLAINQLEEAHQGFHDTGTRGEAVGCLNEILAIDNRWRAPELLSSKMHNMCNALAQELGETEAAWSIAFNVHLAHWRFLARELPAKEAVDEMEKAQGMALANGAHWLISEVAAARVSLLMAAGRPGEAAEAGLELLPRVGSRYSPPKAVPFLLALGEALVQAERFEDLPRVFAKLRRYKAHLESGLAGVRYGVLKARLEARRGRARQSERTLDDAADLAARVREGLADQDLVQAFDSTMRNLGLDRHLQNLTYLPTPNFHSKP